MPTLEEKVMNSMGGLTAVVISGFAIYRWYAGEYRAALTNTLIVATMLGVVALARTTRFARITPILFSITISLSCITSSLFVSNNGLLWIFLVLLINTLIVPRRWTIGLNTGLIIIPMFARDLFFSPIHQVSWVIIAVLISVFALMSMDQLREQRRLLAQQANIDPLTGTGNRRLMRLHLQEAVVERRGDRLAATLIVIDLDKFKQINDIHGHETGDRVLIDFARCVSSSRRADDGFYRMGGEEFVLLLRGMEESIARSYLPSLHQRLSGRVKTASGPVHFSAGVAVLREGETWSQWLARADKALYTAKAEGRNCVRFSDR